MAASECEKFTAESWWPLIEWLTDQLHRRLGQLRRGRAVFVGGSPFLFDGRAPGLQCVGSYHHNPLTRPHAWVSVDVRLGERVGANEYGRSVWEREITLEARLPQTHRRKLLSGESQPVIVQETDWRCSGGHRRRVPLALGALRAQLRDHEQRRLLGDVWQRPLIPPRVWIDPHGETDAGPTPHDVTKMALLLIFWQEGMVKFGPVDSRDAWAWVKGWTRSKDDARCWEIVTQMRQLYVQPEDWRALRLYLGKVCLRLRRRGGRTPGGGRELESAEEKGAQAALRTGGGLSNIETPDDIGEWQDHPVWDRPYASVPSGESPIPCPSCDQAKLVPPAVCPSCGLGIPGTASRPYRRKNRRAGEQS